MSVRLQNVSITTTQINIIYQRIFIKIKNLIIPVRDQNVSVTTTRTRT